MEPESSTFIKQVILRQYAIPDKLIAKINGNLKSRMMQTDLYKKREDQMVFSSRRPRPASADSSKGIQSMRADVEFKKKQTHSVQRGNFQCFFGFDQIAPEKLSESDIELVVKNCGSSYDFPTILNIAFQTLTRVPIKITSSRVDLFTYKFFAEYDQRPIAQQDIRCQKKSEGKYEFCKELLKNLLPEVYFRFMTIFENIERKIRTQTNFQTVQNK